MNDCDMDLAREVRLNVLAVVGNRLSQDLQRVDLHKRIGALNRTNGE